MHMRTPEPRPYFPERFRDAAEHYAHPHPPMKASLHRVDTCGSSEPPRPDDASGVHYVLFVDRNFHVAGECEYLVRFFIDNNPTSSRFDVCALVDEGLDHIHHLARIRRSDLPTYQARRRKLVYGMAH